jgi:hypothetical protein
MSVIQTTHAPPPPDVSFQFGNLWYSTCICTDIYKTFVNTGMITAKLIPGYVEETETYI